MFRKHKDSGLMVALAIVAACNQPTASQPPPSQPPVQPAAEPAHPVSDEQQRRSGSHEAAAAQAPAVPEDEAPVAVDFQPLDILSTEKMAERDISQIDAFAKTLQLVHDTGGDITSAGRDLVVKRARVIGAENFGGLPAIGAILRGGSLHCTGTVIGPQTVLTAAHCVAGYDEKKMWFAVGPNAHDKGARRYKVIDKRVHDGYIVAQLGTHDIAVIYLEQPFSDGPILPFATEDVSKAMETKGLSFIGYGYAEVDSDGSKWGIGEKRKVDMAIRDVDEWTFRYGEEGKNTCNGDSGGPAVLGTPKTGCRVVGVTSWGDGPCSMFGVDMRVDKYATWLTQNMR